jgi:phage terminase large subunit-like protein
VPELVLQPERLWKPGEPSLVQRLIDSGPNEMQRYVDLLTEEEAQGFLYDWESWGRGAQLEPDGDWWFAWLLLAGRGYGKTATGAQWVRKQAETAKCKQMALIAATAADARDVMIEGPAGIMHVSPPWFMPTYEPSKRRLTWPNGVIALVFSADKPDRLRGPQFDGAWCDELGSWRYREAWDNLMLCMRLGQRPRVVITTTPRPTKLIKELYNSRTTVVSAGSTYENLENMAPLFKQQILSKYEGTRLGRQELHAEILTDTPGARWTYEMFDDRPEPEELLRIVVGVDPGVSESGEGDETGIIVAGIGRDYKGYILADRTTGEGPRGWAMEVVKAFDDYKADYVVAESNNGGELVRVNLSTVSSTRAGVGRMPIKLVHASRGKVARADPVANLYEQRRVKHAGIFPELEDELTSWTPWANWSPNRLDALVWAVTELMLEEEEPEEEIIEYYDPVLISRY